MNMFQYTLAIQEIDSFKHNNKREAFIRDKFKQLNNIGVQQWYCSIKDTDLQTATLLYKCCIKCMNAHVSANGLPDFITQGIQNLEHELFTKSIKSSVSYETFINIFEFNSVIKTPGVYKKDLKSLALIFQQNKVPFRIKYNYYTGSISNAINNFVKLGEAFKYVMEASDIKRELGNQKYTILEEFLDDNYKDLVLQKRATTGITEFIGLAQNLETVGNTIKARLEG